MDTLGRAMDFTTIITALSGSGAIAAVAIYLAKKGFERFLDARLRALEEQTRALIQEATRREAAIFDQQLSALKVAVALANRARRSVRKLIYDLSERPDSDASVSLEAFRSSLEDLGTLSLTEQAILPRHIYVLIHRFPTYAAFIEIALREILPETKKESGNSESTSRALKIEGLREEFNRMDAAYQRLVYAVQAHLGVASDAES